MSLVESVPAFLLSLAAVVGGSILLSRSIGHIHRRWSVPEQFLGFLAALGADSPEISTAIVAMISGQNDVSVGVVFGSNLFNLAALLGLTTVLAGRISVRRPPMMLDGFVGILVTGAATMLALGYWNGAVTLAFLLVIIAPYTVLLALRRDSLRALPLPESFKPFVVEAASEERENQEEEARSENSPQQRGRRSGSGCSAAWPSSSLEVTAW